MLTCWVAAQRPAGGQLMTYGRSVEKAMGSFNIDVSTWPELAADRVAWRDAIYGGLLIAERPRRVAAHARCMRAMSRVTLVHTREQHLSTFELTQQMGLESIDVRACPLSARRDACSHAGWRSRGRQVGS